MKLQYFVQSWIIAVAYQAERFPDSCDLYGEKKRIVYSFLQFLQVVFNEPGMKTNNTVFPSVDYELFDGMVS